ncbi:N-acetyllactosaminide beta-1,3-N-acetylglucosaminyltransferase 2 isoform X2 [Struthio camelus]|uniref:N-acetyllactosaminide beta-1,3-N-acetylglucosaminyltransferase 2 isoform X2 n=1 Tax=Struthio camelus TaxID=8801 RepID=UPI0036042E4D
MVDLALAAAGTSPAATGKKSFENNSQAPNALPLLRSALPQLAQIHVLCCWEEDMRNECWTQKIKAAGNSDDGKYFYLCDCGSFKKWQPREECKRTCYYTAQQILEKIYSSQSLLE